MTVYQSVQTREEKKSERRSKKKRRRRNRKTTTNREKRKERKRGTEKSRGPLETAFLDHEGQWERNVVSYQQKGRRRRDRKRRRRRREERTEWKEEERHKNVRSVQCCSQLTDMWGNSRREWEKRRWSHTSDLFACLFFRMKIPTLSLLPLVALLSIPSQYLIEVLSLPA